MDIFEILFLLVIVGFLVGSIISLLDIKPNNSDNSQYKSSATEEKVDKGTNKTTYETEEGGIFKNPGNKLRILAEIYFPFIILVFIALALIFGTTPSILLINTGYFLLDQVELNALFWIFLISGPIVAYLSSLVLYAQGELVQNSTDSRRLLEEIRDNSRQ